MSYFTKLKNFTRMLLGIPGDKLDENKYRIFGRLPVKMERRTPHSPFRVHMLDWKTLVFVPALERHVEETYLGHKGEADIVTKKEFIQYTESLRSREYKKDDEIGVLYEQMNAIEDTAKSEGRELSDMEMDKLSELRTQTYAMFQEKYPDRD